MRPLCYLNFSVNLNQFFQTSFYFFFFSCKMNKVWGSTCNVINRVAMLCCIIKIFKSTCKCSHEIIYMYYIYNMYAYIYYAYVNTELWCMLQIHYSFIGQLCLNKAEKITQWELKRKKQFQKINFIKNYTKEKNISFLHSWYHRALVLDPFLTHDIF